MMSPIKSLFGRRTNAGLMLGLPGHTAAPGGLPGVCFPGILHTDTALIVVTISLLFMDPIGNGTSALVAGTMCSTDLPTEFAQHAPRWQWKSLNMPFRCLEVTG